MCLIFYVFQICNERETGQGYGSPAAAIMNFTLLLCWKKSGEDNQQLKKKHSEMAKKKKAEV